MSSAQDCNSLQSLQRLVDSGFWKIQPGLANQIFSRYCELVVSGQRLTNFGNVEFWDEILGDDGSDSHQQGHGNVGDNDVAQPLQDQGRTIEIIPSNFYELTPLFKKSSRRFGSDYGQYDLRFKNMHEGGDIELLLLAIFTDVLDTIKADSLDDDLIGIVIKHPALDMPIVVALRRSSEMTADLVVDAIVKVLQSKDELTFDERMTVYFTKIKRPAGSGWTKRK